MLRTAVIGASGYAGGELLRLISLHPDLELVNAIANSHAGEAIDSIFPNLKMRSVKFGALQDISYGDLEVVFLALPHGESSKIISNIPKDVLVVDLGADFRLENQSDWESFYQGNHAGTWTYGMADIKSQHNEIKNSTRVANPGCYATAINLGAAPLFDSGLLHSSEFQVVAMSGTSGAGRRANENLLTAENMNSLAPYKVGGTHQHTPEIEQFLTSISGRSIKVSFTPILAPMPRGILAVLQFSANGVRLEDFYRVFRSFYDGNTFIQILDSDRMPNTKSVSGTNNVQIGLALDTHVDKIIVSVVLDNLVKGAAGQAIQNLNLMADLGMTTGLQQIGIYP